MKCAAEASEPYDLVLVDFMMPEMDGFTVIERLRQQSPVDCPAIIMLTSAQRPEDAARCRRMKLAAYLSKPIKSTELQSAILTCLSKKRGDGDAPAGQANNVDARAETLTPARPLKILLAEDNPVNQRFAVHLLAKAGHAAHVVEDGQAAIDALARDEFDLVLMDVQMPKMDGLEATQYIRANESADGPRLPIIAMTAHAMAGDRERCLAAGMDDYVSKPIDAKDFFRAIYTLVGGHCPSEDQSKAPVPPTEVFNHAAALHQMEGNEELLADIIQLFLGDLPTRMTAIEAAAAAGDAPSLRNAAHALKGALGYLAAHRAREAARRLEELGAAGDAASAPAALDAFRVEIDRLTAQLEPLATPTAELAAANS
jgi:CheY-like chemotaxis protein